MNCPYVQNLICDYPITTGDIICTTCPHYNREVRSTGAFPKITLNKFGKRIIFGVLVILNLTILFVPNMFYWIWTGKGFLADRLNMLYFKWILK
jgi:hypothetical protein